MYIYQHPERQVDIENHNTILVDRMMHSSSYLRPKKQPLLKESLNSGLRSRVDRQIDNGNQVYSFFTKKLVRRLQSAKSQYSAINKSAKEYHKYKSNMAFSRMDPYYDLETQAPRQMRPYSAKR